MSWLCFRWINCQEIKEKKVGERGKKKWKSHNGKLWVHWAHSCRRISYFWVAFCLCDKTCVKANLGAKLLIWKCVPPTGSLPCKSKSFSYERFCTKPRFETETQGNLKVAIDLTSFFLLSKFYVIVLLTDSLACRGPNYYCPFCFVGTWVLSHAAGWVWEILQRADWVAPWTDVQLRNAVPKGQARSQEKYVSLQKLLGLGLPVSSIFPNFDYYFFIACFGDWSGFQWTVVNPKPK